MLKHPLEIGETAKIYRCALAGNRSGAGCLRRSFCLSQSPSDITTSRANWSSPKLQSSAGCGRAFMAGPNANNGGTRNPGAKAEGRHPYFSRKFSARSGNFAERAELVRRLGISSDDSGRLLRRVFGGQT